MKKLMIALLLTITVLTSFTSANDIIDLNDDYTTISNIMNVEIENNPSYYQMYIHVLSDIAGDTNRNIMFRIKMILVMCMLTA